MQGIKLSVCNVGARRDIVLITIIGYVDTATCNELIIIIQDHMKQNHYQIIADLGGVSYISSAGWGVFVGEIKNIRDKGGDLKIVQMTSEVFEVFEMLEFNRILNFYDTLEEAIDEFDIIRGIDITKVEELKSNAQKQPIAITKYPGASLGAGSKKWKSGGRHSAPAITPQEFALVEKIKLIVIEQPLKGAGYIRKRLRNEKYGNTKLGWVKIRSILKDLNLENKEKRFRFYRSR